MVFLSSAQGAELTKPFQAVIAINDTFQDGKPLGMPAGGSDPLSVFSLMSTSVILKCIPIFIKDRHAHPFTEKYGTEIIGHVSGTQPGTKKDAQAYSGDTVGSVPGHHIKMNNAINQVRQIFVFPSV